MGLRRWRDNALVLLAILVLPGVAVGRTSKGDKLWKEAQEAEARKEYERALELYALAEQKEPSNSVYLMAERRVRALASRAHVSAGEEDRSKGELDAALAEFKRAFSVDPSNELALQEARRTSEIIERNKKGGAVAGGENLTAVEIEKHKRSQKLDAMLPAPELKPIQNRITMLKMNNQPVKVLYETVAKLAGVNVIFDPQLPAPPHNTNLDIANSSLQDALDDVALLTKTFWKPINANTIFVTDDNPTKRHDYEDQVVKVIYLHNVTTVQEFQEVVTAVRSATDIRRMFTYTGLNAVIARGSPDQIALAERLFRSLDHGKPEVQLDIVVMSVNSSRTRTLAATLADSKGIAGLNLPVAFTPRSSIATPSSSSTTTSTSVSLGQLGKVGTSDFSLTLPGALLQAIASDSTTRILHSPQVRASDGQKVTLKIVDRLPYATGSFQTGTTGTSLSPLVSTQFNFVDVGVSIEMTAHVHGEGELSMHLVVDLSTLSRYVDLGGGLSQPVISQQKDEADVRLREGEVNLLGGLTQLTNTKSLSGIPGLVSIPILGRALGSNTLEKDRGELLIALIPHVVRTPDLSVVDFREIAAGTEQNVKVNFARDVEGPPFSDAHKTEPPVKTDQLLSFSPDSVEVPSGGQFEATLTAGGASDSYTSKSLHLKWDPALVRLNNITAPDQAGELVYDVRNDSGEATISRAGAAPVIRQAGTLVKVSFTAVAKGSGRVTISDGEPRGTLVVVAK